LFPAPRSDNFKKNIAIISKIKDSVKKKRSHQFAFIKSDLVANRVVKVKEGKNVRGLGLLEKFNKFIRQSSDLHFLRKFVDFGSKSYSLEVLHLTIHKSRKLMHRD
jgi:hypothetical protein